VHDALARELREETGLAYAGDVAHACTVHYLHLLPGGTLTHAVVHVFDGCGDGVTAALGAGAIDSPDPGGTVQVVELVPLATAIERLGATHERVVREPLLAYLTGDCPAGGFWSWAVMWSDVLAFLQTARFVDLLLPGWIDRTGPFPVHRPLTFDACLQAESVPEDGIFRAAEMTFEDTCTVFFDPCWRDGIRLGTGNTPDLWLAEHRSPRFQELFGPLKETTWLPARH